MHSRPVTVLSDCFVSSFPQSRTDTKEGVSRFESGSYRAKIIYQATAAADLLQTDAQASAG